MKIRDIISVTEAYENDYSAQSGMQWKPEEFELVFQAIKGAEVSKEEIIDLAKTLGERDDFDRTTAGAVFALNRMHILVHGTAPYGETESRAEKMFGIPDTMIRFARSKGYDTFENIEKARAELKGRPVRRKEPEARQMMAAYFQQNKERLPRDITQHRKAIINDLMAGLTAEEAFGRYS